jgi:predicted glycoside hydrolase/deacetylase ChbG (UPF0249 family)
LSGRVSPPRTLIVNADDFGLTTGVSEGVLRAHAAGIVTSTSVLALGSAFDRTVGWLAETPSLGVGAHLALVGEDPPLLSAREVPSLVDRRGRLPLSFRTFLPRALSGRVDPVDVRRELSAQLDAIEAAGVALDHLDTHQHLHLWPAVGRVVVDLACERAIPAVRVPRSAAGGATGIGVRQLSSRLERRLRAAGLGFPQASAGLDEAGAMTLPALVETVGRLGRTTASICELSVHPGADPDPGRRRYDWRYAWGAELEALIAPEARDRVRTQGFELGSYGVFDGKGNPIA